MTTLLRRLVSRPSRPGPLARMRVTVYGRAECCCCHAAVEALRPYRERFGFEVEEVDVDTDPALAEAHGPSVPVVAIDGKVRFRGAVNAILLDRLLASKLREVAR